MNVLASAIRLYQRSRVVNTAVRLSVRAHHAVTPNRARAVCPHLGHCSNAGLAAALGAPAGTMGLAALPGILSRMSACTGLGEGYTRSGVDGDCHELGVMMPHPMEGGGGC